MLTLPIKKKWFDMILSGEKKEEYREIKPCYTSRFANLFCINATHSKYHIQNIKNFLQSEYAKKNICEEIMFRNGYSKILPHSLQSVRCQSAQERKNGEQRKEKSILS